MSSPAPGFLTAIRELRRLHSFTILNAQFVTWVFSFYVGSITWAEGGSIVRAAAINLAIQIGVIAIVLVRYVTPFKPLSPDIAKLGARTLLLISLIWMCAALALILALNDSASETPLVFDLLIAFQLVAAWLGVYGVYWLAAKWCAPTEAT